MRCLGCGTTTCAWPCTNPNRATNTPWSVIVTEPAADCCGSPRATWTSRTMRERWGRRLATYRAVASVVDVSLVTGPDGLGCVVGVGVGVGVAVGGGLGSLTGAVGAELSTRVSDPAVTVTRKARA